MSTGNITTLGKLTSIGAMVGFMSYFCKNALQTLFQSIITKNIQLARSVITNKFLMYFSIGGLLTYLLHKYCQGGLNKYTDPITEKIIIITGANSGIGKICTQELAMMGAKKVIMACRSEKRGAKAMEDIAKSIGSDHNIDLMLIDLSDQESILNFCKEFKSKYKRLDVLLNNGGIKALPKRQLTKQGFEMQFGVNYLGHFTLTNMLLDMLKKTKGSRVVNVSSNAHRNKFKYSSSESESSDDVNHMHWDDLQMENCYHDMEAYAQSKYAIILFSKQLNKMGYKSATLNPGLFISRQQKNIFKGSPVFEFFVALFWWFTPIVFKSHFSAAQTSLHLSCIPIDKFVSGEHYKDCDVYPAKLVGDWEQEAQKLWDISQEMVKEHLQQMIQHDLTASLG